MIPRYVWARRTKRASHEAAHLVDGNESPCPWAQSRVGARTLDDQRVLDGRTEVRPDSDYGASKAFGEALGRMYADRFGMRVVCLRIGSVLPDDDPAGPWPLAGAGWMPWLTDADRRARIRATWLSHRDCAELVRCALEADVRFVIAYGVSDNTRRFWSLDVARDILGFAPVDRAPA